MRRADRLLQIVQLLRGGRLTTAARLAEQLEVSERTIYRDIATLQSTGVPIDGEAGVGYVMAEGYDLPPLMFTRDEITALVAGARMIRAFGGAAMARGAEEALIKIESVLPEAERERARAVQVHAMSWDIPGELRLVLDRLEQATDNRLFLEFSYTDAEGAESTRKVRPLGLWFWGKVWTMLAWCELRNNFRLFRADRIEDLQEGEKFAPDPDKSLKRYLWLREQGLIR